MSKINDMKLNISNRQQVTKIVTSYPKMPLVVRKVNPNFTSIVYSGAKKEYLN